MVQDKIDILKKDLPRIIRLTFNEKVNPQDFKMDGITILSITEKGVDLKIKGPLEPLLKILQKYKTHNLEIPESPLENYFMEFYKTGNDK